MLTLVSVLALVAVGGVGFLFMELQKVNGELAGAWSDLVGAQAELGEVRADLVGAQAELGEVRADLVGAQAELGDMSQELDGLRAELSDVNSQNTVIAAQYAQSLSSNVRLENALGEVGADLVGAQAELGDMNQELDDLGAELSDVNSQNTVLAAQYAELEGTVGFLEALTKRVQEMSQELDDLRAQREPLILGHNSVVSHNFACTGSMEPVLTCLDKATFLYDFKPEDVAVGATIDYRSNCRDDGGVTTHRVMSIKVENGIYHYWPKGDGVEEPDGCWVPHTDVIGYIIAIEKDVVMENSVLRGQVNAARAVYIDAKDDYDVQNKAYLDLRQKYKECGGSYAGTCPSYNKVSAKYFQVLEADLRYRTAYTWYSDCWLTNAKRSLYPGHIPFDCGLLAP